MRRPDGDDARPSGVRRFDDRDGEEEERRRMDVKMHQLYHARGANNVDCVRKFYARAGCMAAS